MKSYIYNVPMNNEAILVTGGLGYIGSHVCVSLIENGYTPIILDNLSNSDLSVLTRISKISGVDVPFYKGDICDINMLHHIFNAHDIKAVMHFAGLKSVSESSKTPIIYYENNVAGTVNLLKAMHMHRVFSMVFSSSATVYGSMSNPPFTETSPTGDTTNPYGQSKVMVEKILDDYAASNPLFTCVTLRYFNPVGAHESGLLGENPNGVPNNLMPYIAMVANKDLKSLSVYGDDYDTKDGTGERDYIHVMDLAEGHVATLKREYPSPGIYIYNLGTGKPSSVLEVIHAYENACGHKISYTIEPRRDGDVAVSYAAVQKAKDELGWRATRSLQQACDDSWNFIQNSKKQNVA